MTLLEDRDITGPGFVTLRDHQLEAIDDLSNGKILWGNIGSGKSVVALAYYVKYLSPRHIYVITPGKKRDSLEWEGEAAKFGISTDADLSLHGAIIVDSWHKLHHYEGIHDAFFIFDEQRLTGHGAWVKSFLKIAKKNKWIMLSATPGDNWMDYVPVFLANGYYKNRTSFLKEHVVFDPWVKFPKVKFYRNETKLALLRNNILVEMPYDSHTKRFLNYTDCSYDFELFKRVYKDRWHVYENRPIKDAAEMFRVMRRVVNSDPSRLENIRYFMQAHPRMVVFYNFNYELEILRALRNDVWVLEWNGHKKEFLPDGDEWIYLVQYVAGAEAWNCTATNAMVLYSLTYSYKNFKQAQGRIDRIDTPFDSLYYYILVSNSIVDRAIRSSLEGKRDFNERKFMREMGLNEWV